MNKQEIILFLREHKIVSVPDKFTGQIILTINLNQGGVTDVEKSVKERIK